MLDSFADALNDVFLAGVPFVLIALVCAFFLPEVRLGERVVPGAATVAEGAARAPGPTP